MSKVTRDSIDANPILDLEFDDITEPDLLLDAAMREREALEDAERDERVLRSYHAVRTGRALFFGKAFSGFALLASLLFPGVARADEPRTKRPTVCTAGSVVSGPNFTGYLCTDGKRPKLFTRHVVVSFVDADGNPRSYVLGWTGAPVKGGKAPSVPAAGLVRQ